MFSNGKSPASKNNSDEFFIERKSSLFSLALAYVSIIHNNMSRGNISDYLDDLVGKVVNDTDFKFVPWNDQTHAFVMYYIAGWLLCAAEKECENRGSKFIGKFINIFVNNTCCVDADCARSASLPTQKVETADSYGGLKYASKEFYYFVWAIEFMFCSVLTDENFTIFGGKLLMVVSDFVKTHLYFVNKFNEFFEGEIVDDQIVSDIFAYLLQTYTRMRGKDLVQKIMGRTKLNLKLHTRQKMAALSDLDTHKQTLSEISKVCQLAKEEIDPE
uniref:Uncharacterized protein n=1 Tax=Corethron hystrix TaxID=216773 RepID=A0A7S1FUV8_9STRA|mmetsp:Transcript_33845/g.78148  ORF Transcript_33845/g.78148 Transcript_33845/m.78148 type:complete len:273 (+) Transcript_33845:1056-1874(+)